MRLLDELRPLSAGRVLALWRASRDEAEDAPERALLCNAAILAECCLRQGEPVYSSPSDVLDDLSGREMEALLERLCQGGGPGRFGAEFSAPEDNPAFDMARFRALGKE